MLLPHRLELHASRYLAVALGLLHLAALASLVPLPLSAPTKLLMAAAIALSSAVSVYRHALRQSASSIRVLFLNDDGTIRGERNDGSWFEAKVAGQSTVFQWMVVMLIDLPGGHRFQPLIILPDSLPAGDGRILRAWLRWKLT